MDDESGLGPFGTREGARTDLRRVVVREDTGDPPTVTDYDDHGEWAATTPVRRPGDDGQSWADALGRGLVVGSTPTREGPPCPKLSSVAGPDARLMDRALDGDSTFTGEYAQDFGTWSEYYDSGPEVDVLSTHAEFSDGRVLEAGCGSGRLSFRVSQDNFSLTCVDIVPSLVQHCHNRLVETFEGDQSRLRFEVQDIQDLPYPDDHFDAVLDGWTFSTLEDRGAGASEYKRVLNTDGTLYAIEFREGSPYQRIIDKFAPEDAYEEDLPAPDTMMENAFGEATATEEIVSEYRFPTQQEAFEALWFNFTEWLDLDLSEGDAQTLKNELESHRTGEGIIIKEYAKFYKYDDLGEVSSQAVRGGCPDP